MVTSSRTPVRTDRLRALNLPVPVLVVADGNDGLPTGIVEERDESAERRKGGTAVEKAERRNGGTAEGKGERVTYRRTAVPPGGEEVWGGSARNIAEVIEVWRVDDEWWRRQIKRKYVEVILEGGTHAVLFEDEITNEWFMQTP